MSKSLQDQLLELGLAKEKVREKAREKVSGKAGRGPAQKAGAGGHRPAHSSATRKHTDRPARRPPATENTSPDNIAPDNISLEQAYRIREQVEKSAKQRARERKMEEDRQRAALNKQIRAIIDTGRLNLADASEARYFMYKNRIRKVWASKDQLAGLNDGTLGVVYLTGGYHILAAEHIEAVRQLSPDHVADLLSGASDDEELWAAYEQDQKTD